MPPTDRIPDPEIHCETEYERTLPVLRCKRLR